MRGKGKQWRAKRKCDMVCTIRQQSETVGTAKIKLYERDWYFGNYRWCTCVAWEGMEVDAVECLGEMRCAQDRACAPRHRVLPVD